MGNTGTGSARKRNLPCIVMGVIIGVFIGRAVWQYVDFRIHHQVYAAWSAPWYVALLPHGVLTLAAVLACLIWMAVANWHRSKKREVGKA